MVEIVNNCVFSIPSVIYSIFIDLTPIFSQRPFYFERQIYDIRFVFACVTQIGLHFMSHTESKMCLNSLD